MLGSQYRLKPQARTDPSLQSNETALRAPLDELNRSTTRPHSIVGSSRDAGEIQARYFHKVKLKLVAARDLGGKNEPVLTMVNNLPVFRNNLSCRRV
jgi:hypothetical protein